MYTKYPEVFIKVKERMVGNISTDPKAIKKSGNADFCIEQTVFETLDYLEDKGMLKEPRVNLITMKKPEHFKYELGATLKKKSGSEWVGKVVGFYSTEQTREGYALESVFHKNTVQIYPVQALMEVDISLYL